jgi:hypothetical protein
MKKHVRCVECRYAVINKKASLYIPKSREIKWKAIQCVCSNSEYHRATLTLSANGDMQNYISCGGCRHGVKRGAV